ncbi:MAG: flippase-like domain-containing protein [Candidatus Marinimicrobia bacterium]|nr:flippase-like domain-containing protein [Candidatus Neomarinimicrobiota bacterium]
MQIYALVKEHPIKFIVSITVSLGLIWYSFKDLEWIPFWQALTSVNYWLLLLGAILLVFSNVIRAARWRILLLPQKELKRKALFEATLMGYMGNNVLPFKLGEALRVVVVAERHDIPMTGVGASVVVERGLDVFSFLILAGLYGSIFPTFETARLLSALALAVVIMAISFGYFMNRYHEQSFAKIEAWSERMTVSGHPKRAEHLLSAFKGLETIWRTPQPLHVIWQTLLLWGLYLLITYLGVAAFGFGLTPLALLEVAVMLTIFTTFSLSIPAAPGYVGTYHGAVLAALALFDIDNDAARALAIVLHLMNFLIYTPLGAWYLVKAGLSLDLATEKQIQGKD